MKYIILQNPVTKQKFWSSNNSTWKDGFHKILGYADTPEEAQVFIFEQAYSK